MGDSSRSRKGSSWDHVHRLISGADPAIATRILTGLERGGAYLVGPRPHRPGGSRRRGSTAAGDRAGVRQRAQERRPRDQHAVTDAALGVGRAAPAILTRTAPARATDAHISVIGHITATELRHHVNAVELANGLLNRFLLLSVRRVRLLPEGGDPDPLNRTGLDRRLVKTLDAARPRRRDPPRTGSPRPLARRLPTPRRTTARDRRRDQRARRSAHDPARAHIRAARPRPRDRAGAPRCRARALGLRAALSHLGARAHDRRPARPPDPRRAHPRAPQGLTRTQLRDLLHRNPTTQQLDQALAKLADDGKITSQRVLTAGRPAELWTATRRPRIRSRQRPFPSPTSEAKQAGSRAADRPKRHGPRQRHARESRSDALDARREAKLPRQPPFERSGAQHPRPRAAPGQDRSRPTASSYPTMAARRDSATTQATRRTAPSRAPARSARRRNPTASTTRARSPTAASPAPGP